MTDQAITAEPVEQEVDLEIGERLFNKVTQRRSDLKNGLTHLRNPTISEEQRKQTQIDVDNIRQEIDAYLNDSDYLAYVEDQQRKAEEAAAEEEARQARVAEQQQQRESDIDALRGELSSRIAIVEGRIKAVEDFAHEHVEE